jgi:hypothetical protein
MKIHLDTARRDNVTMKIHDVGLAAVTDAQALWGVQRHIAGQARPIQESR